MTVQEVARYLHVHANTVYRMARRGRLPAFKVGSDWRFNRESIDRWRLAQEGARQSGAAADLESRKALQTEVWDIISWYVTEGLASTIGIEDIEVFAGRDRRVLASALAELADEGLLEAVGSKSDRRYRLTAAGLTRARQNARKRSGHAPVIDLGAS